MSDPIIRKRGDRTLVDRDTLATLLNRSVNTIRVYCPVATRTASGRPLYDAERCAEILATVPTRPRQRTPVD